MQRQKQKTHKSKPPEGSGKKVVSYPPDRVYGNIDEAAKNCRKVYFIYLSLLSYALLTAVTTSNKQLILGENVKLPLINMEVSAYLFFMLTPIIAIAILTYIQLYLLKVNELIQYSIEECREENPHCPNQGDHECDIYHICTGYQSRLYPWMIIFSRYSNIKVVGKLQRLLANLSLWWLLPIILMAFSLLIIKKHENISSIILLLLTILGTIFEISFWVSSKQVRIVKPNPKDQKDKNYVYHHSAVNLNEKEMLTKPYTEVKFFYNIKKAKKYPGCIALSVLVILFSVFHVTINYKVREGVLWSESDNWGENVDFATKWFRNWFFVDLSQKNLISGPNGTQKSEMLYWVNLENTNLAGANLASTILTKANLKNSKLTNANLLGANLDDADLEQANLNSAKLAEASLIGSFLFETNLKKSDLLMAKLQGANLVRAQLQNSDLGKADLSEAELKSSDLRDANLRQANLRAANLEGASLKNARLNEADLLYANLLGVKEVTAIQIKEAKNWQMALYDQLLSDNLGLPKDHNQRVNQRIFANYDLKNAYLEKADLIGANLLGANLQGADLTNAKLWATNLQKAILVGAKLERAELLSAQLREANLRKTNLRHANLHQAILSGADLMYADFRQAENIEINQLQKAMNWMLALYNEDLITRLGLEPDHNKRVLKKDFSHCKYFNGANLRMADLQGANLRGVDLRMADLQGANLRGADLSKADLHQASLVSADLLFADLRLAKEIKVEQLHRAKNWQLATYHPEIINDIGLPQDHNKRVEKKNFSGYDLREADLHKAELQGANLREAKLDNAILRETNLKGANLEKAQLVYADLEGADLRNAILYETDLSDANFCDADLRGIFFLKIEQFSDVDNLLRAELDDNIKKQLSSKYPSKF